MLQCSSAAVQCSAHRAVQCSSAHYGKYCFRAAGAHCISAHRAVRCTCATVLQCSAVHTERCGAPVLPQRCCSAAVQCSAHQALRCTYAAVLHCAAVQCSAALPLHIERCGAPVLRCTCAAVLQCSSAVQCTSSGAMLRTRRSKLNNVERSIKDDGRL